VACGIVIFAGLNSYRMGRVWRPLITDAEFAFIPHIATLTPDDAVIVVPQTMMTPRVA